MEVKAQIFKIIIICLLGFQNIIAQPCDSNGNGFTFYNQDDVDNFAQSHPSCDSISGNLVIGSEILNLEGLHSIIGIGGALIIEDNPLIESLSGLQNLEIIGGNVYINNCGAIKNMIGLSNLNKIEGDLYIHECGSLKDLDGLDNLDTIKGSLTLSSNDSLQTLTGLSSVDYYGSDITISKCGKIGNLEGLLGLNHVRGNFLISSNPKLDSLKGLKFLVKIDGHFTIINNPELDILGKDEPDLKYGPYQLEQIDGDLIIENNDALRTLSGLNGLLKILRHFRLEGNEVLFNLSHLMGLQEVSEILRVTDNPALINLNGFEQLTEVGGIGIDRNPSMTSLFGLHNLKNIKGDFTLGSGNSALIYVSGGIEIPGTTIHRLLDLKHIGGNLNISETSAVLLLGFYNLDSIGGNLNISRNNFLNGVYDFANLKHIGGVLSFSYNSQLSEIQFSNLKYIGGLSLDNNRSLLGIVGLFNLEEIGNYGLLIEEDNELLKNLQGLEKVRYIAGDLKLYDSDLRDFSGINPSGGLSNLDSIGGSLWLDLNRYLFDFTGLSNLKSIGKDVFINNSFSLVSIYWLSKLKKIGGRIDIAQNQYLTSLVGLDNIDYESIQDLSLSANENLSGCEVKSICNYLFNDGSANIVGNASNCSSQQEVIEACNTVGTEDIQVLSRITIAPNPMTDYFSINTDETFPVRFQIYNVYGQNVKSGNVVTNENLNISQLPSGTYIIGLELNGEYAYRRFVKI